jgi:hypothetical protein
MIFTACVACKNQAPKKSISKINFVKKRFKKNQAQIDRG